MVQCTIKDLTVICKMLEHHTDRCWYTSDALKAVTVNKICKAFDGTNSVHECSTHKSTKVYNPALLRSTVKEEVLLTSDYKVEHLQIALGTVLSREMCCAWDKRSTVDYTQMIPLADENNPEKFEAMELFAYPEQSVEGELLFHTFDYTHILTNMHSHILTHGYDYCKKEDFEWIVDNMTGILSQY